MALLTRNDINKIIYDFDCSYFATPKPATALEVAQKYCVINQFENYLEKAQFPLEVVDGIVRHCLRSSPSVGALLMYYRGSPSFQNRDIQRLPDANRNPQIISLNNGLEGASRSLLIQLKKEPTHDRTELACFKQLMNLVFEEYLNKINLEERLTIVNKIQRATWEFSDAELLVPNNPFVQLNQLQQKLQMNQAGWDNAKVRLQLASWKIQLVIARVLSSLGARVCLIVGSGYCAVRTYFWLKSIGYKIAYKFGQNFEKLSEYGLRMLGVDPHARGGSFPLKAFVILMTVLLSSVVGGAYLVARIHILCKDRFPPLLLDIVEWPFVTVSKLIDNPAGVAVNLGFGIYNIGEALTAHVARSMDAAAVAASKNKYIQDKMPSLKDKWHQLVLNAPQ
jgi:hypothetical protein